MSLIWVIKLIDALRNKWVSGEKKNDTEIPFTASWKSRLSFLFQAFAAKSPWPSSLRVGIRQHSSAELVSWWQACPAQRTVIEHYNICLQLNEQSAAGTGAPRLQKARSAFSFPCTLNIRRESTGPESGNWGSSPTELNILPRVSNATYFLSSTLPGSPRVGLSLRARSDEALFLLSPLTSSSLLLTSNLKSPAWGFIG